MQRGANFPTLQTELCPAVNRNCDSFLLISFMILLSTYVQSLERSIQRTTKLGLVKTCGGHSLRCCICDLRNHYACGCLAYLQLFLGYQDPSWTTVLTFQHNYVQVNLERMSNSKFAFEMENFIKEYVSSKLSFAMTLSGTLGRILQHRQP